MIGCEGQKCLGATNQDSKKDHKAPMKSGKEIVDSLIDDTINSFIRMHKKTMTNTWSTFLLFIIFVYKNQIQIHNLDRNSYWAVRKWSQTVSVSFKMMLDSPTRSKVTFLCPCGLCK